MSDNLVCKISQDSTAVAHRKGTTEEVRCKGYNWGVNSSGFSSVNTKQLCFSASQKRVIKMSLLLKSPFLRFIATWRRMPTCRKAARNGNRKNQGFQASLFVIQIE